MARIILLSPPFVSEYMRNARCDFVSLSATQWYPILLGYAGAWLEKIGHTVRLIDAPAHDLTHETTADIIREFRPDLIAVYSGRLSEDNDVAFADSLLKEIGCRGIFVGPYASIDPRATLSKSACIEHLVTGPFELPLGAFANGDDPATIPNLVRKIGEKIVENPRRPPLTTAELDAIPFVSDFLGRNVDLYRYHTPSELFPYMDMFTGRGCHWGLCTYCLWVHTLIPGKSYTTRSVENVVEEFRFIERKMPAVRSIMLQDDTLIEPRAQELCEGFLRAGTSLPWSCYSRGNLSFETMRLMKRTGCRNLHVGYESADPKVLQRIRKGLTPERMTRFTRDAKRAGLKIHGDFAFGFPGETVESAERTIRWAYALNPDTAQFQLMIPFPGTTYYEDMKKNGWLNEKGEPDMPQFSNAQIRATAKKAYRTFYMSLKHLMKAVRSPNGHIFNQLKTISRAIPAMFWKRW